jgi:CRISPR/Cas system-associated protein Csx1
LPSLYIKLGLTKIFVKAMDQESEEFSCLRQNLSTANATTRKEVIIVVPQITQQFADHDFSTKLNSTERRAWKASENICRNFLRNEKAENHSEIVRELI